MGQSSILFLKIDFFPQKYRKIPKVHLPKVTRPDVVDLLSNEISLLKI